MKKYLGLFGILLFFSCTEPTRGELTVATYNIRLEIASDTQEGDGWAQRSPFVIQLATFHDFDLFGMQEVLRNQLTDVLTGMPDYTYIGVGRKDGKEEGEYSPILYKKDKFKLLASDTFWLSDIPDSPGKGWDAAYERVCTWGHFEEAATGFRFFAFNLHMDHIGVEARRNSTALVLTRVGEIAGNSPVLLMGDFNFDQHDANYGALAGSDILKDSFEEAEVRYANNGTFNEFDPAKFSLSRIDHIFASDHFLVYRYGILTDSYRQIGQDAEATPDSAGFDSFYEPHSTCRLPSDHFPVMIKLRYTVK